MRWEDSPLNTGFCPITGRKVELRPEWEVIDSNYHLVFGYMEPGILFTRPSGKAEPRHIEQFFNKLDLLLKEKKCLKYSVVSDYSNLTLFNKEARNLAIERIQNEPRMTTMNVFGATTYAKINLHLGHLFLPSSSRLRMAKDYVDALQNALRTVENEEDWEDNSKKWEYEKFDGGYSICMVNHRLIYSRPFGKIDDEISERYLKALIEAIKYVRFINGEDLHYRILDTRDVTEMPFKLRRSFAQKMASLGEEYNCQEAYLLGYNFFTRLALQLTKGFFKHNLVVVSDVQEARVRMSLKEKGGSEKKIVSMDGTLMGRLLDDLATVQWDQPGELHVRERDTPEEILPIYQALSIVKADIDQLLEERRVREKELLEERERSAILTKELTSSLKQSEKFLIKAQESAKAKKEFLANMSHEIRTPMNAVVGMAEILLHSDLNEEQYVHVKTLANSAVDLLHILNDILDFSKLEADKLAVEKISYPLQKTLRESFDLMEVKGVAKGLEMHFQFDEKLPEFVIGDPIRMKQVVLNLLSNALKFTDRGSITLWVGLLTRDPLRFQVVVKDTGIGIPEDTQGKLFQSFSQGDASITRKFGGTGLGLVICKQLVRLMGGEMQYQSIVGSGSEFSFVLPLVIGKAPIGEVDKNKWNPEKILKVLLVEDNLVNQKVFLKLLKMLSAKIEVASNGEEGVKKALVSDFDLILMDVQMPILDGLMATREIRQKEKKKNIIIALTANALEGDRERCIEAGMDDYLTKPLTFNVLEKCFLKWFRS